MTPSELAVLWFAIVVALLFTDSSLRVMLESQRWVLALLGLALPHVQW